jgi:iron complex outermembrane receptor protein
VESTVILSPHDRFTLNLSYLNAKFRTVNLAGGTAATVAFGQSLAGFNLPRSPHWAIAPGYAHVFDVAPGSTLVASVDARFETESNLAIPSNAAALAAGWFRQPSFAKVNASLAYNPAGAGGASPPMCATSAMWAHCSISLPTAYTNTVPVFGVSNLTNLSFEASDPRTYGVTVTGKF